MMCTSRADIASYVRSSHIDPILRFNPSTFICTPHSAEDWNLAKPLATCNLQVIRRDNSLCINIMADRPKPGAPAGATETYLFAQSNITVDFSTKSYRMDHW